MQRVGPFSSVLPAIAVFIAVSLPLLPAVTLRAADQGQISPEALHDLRVALTAQYQAENYNDYLRDVIADQQVAKSAIEQQRQNYNETKPEIVPLMQEMIRSLRRFVESDLPFDLETRRARVNELAEYMGRSDPTLADKLRRILDVYQVEMSYGREVDARVGWLEVDGPRREVTFLRLGRLVLAYQTHDGAETGFFNPSTKQWEPLPEEYRDSISAGLRIARKQAAPVLLRMPVPAPVSAE